MLWIDIDIDIYNIDKVSDKKYSVLANIISRNPPKRLNAWAWFQVE